MMKKIILLSTCDTCKRISKEIGVDDSWEIQDIKKNHISTSDLEAIHDSGFTYDELFNKRAQKYKAQGLKDQTLTEADLKKLILGEYTFLKRPIIQIGEKYFVGNSKKVVAAAIEELNA